MIRRIARLLHVARREDGYVLPVVMGLGLVMVAIVATSLSVTLSGVQKSNNDANWNAALAAAYAGIEDYKSRLQNDISYNRAGNMAAPFSAGSTGLVLPSGANANAAFNIAAGQPWAAVPGAHDASFRYEVNNSKYPGTGVLRIRSTGRVGDVTRTVISDLKQEGFNNYVYFTDFEIQDPIISGSSSCALKYAWQRTGCTDIQFQAIDHLRGKVHSNDQMVICEAHFELGVTTASTTSPIYKTPSGCDPADFQGGPPVKVSKIDMPPSNIVMLKEVRSDLPAEVPASGCLYTGPTSITLNSNGTMTVVSPWTKKTNLAATDAGATSPAKCGVISQLNSVAGATIPVMDHNLVYVQNVPLAPTTDPNYWASTARPTGFTCSDSTKATERWSYTTGSPAATIAYPATVGSNVESSPVTSTTTYPAYGCRNGDLFTKGVLKGQMTMAAKNYIYITGDITYSVPTADVLGLVGENAIWIWNPMKITGTTTLTYTPLLPKNRTIWAAMLSVNHTIQVQNYQYGGSRGTLTIVGSMAQRYRGTVGTSGGSQGYAKDYSYDFKLTYSSPPKYLTPTSTTFDTTQIAGVPSAYTANGAPK